MALLFNNDILDNSVGIYSGKKCSVWEFSRIELVKKIDRRRDGIKIYKMAEFKEDRFVWCVEYMLDGSKYNTSSITNKLWYI